MKKHLMILTFVAITTLFAAKDELRPFPLRTMFGFNDFKDKSMPLVKDNPDRNQLVFKDSTLDNYSGWAKDFNLTVTKESRIILKVQGTININSEKLIKLYVKLAKQDLSMLCTNELALSDDPAYLAPSDGVFEFAFPTEVVTHGPCDGFGFIFPKGLVLKDVTFEFFIK